MESHTLKKLVEKYWQGETTLEEEKLLDHILADDHSSEYSDLVEYRNAIKAKKETQVLDDGFDQEILSQIKVQRMPFYQKTWWVNIAASITLIMGLGLGGYFLSSDSPVQEFSPTELTEEEEARIAYEEVKKILFKVSDNMNEGMDHTRVLGEFHKAKLELETTN